MDDKLGILQAFSLLQKAYVKICKDLFGGCRDVMSPAFGSHLSEQQAERWGPELDHADTCSSAT